MIDSANRIQQSLISYKNTLEQFQKDLEKPEDVTEVKVRKFLREIKKARIEHAKAFTAQKSQNAQLAQNTANAIRAFLANLASVKGVIEVAAIHVLSEVEEELDKEEKHLEQEAQNEYNTVGDVEEGGLDLQ